VAAPVVTSSIPTTSSVGATTATTFAETVPNISQLVSGIIQPTPVKQDVPEENKGGMGGFNIDQMLEKITQQVTGQPEEMEDSPASPPAFAVESSEMLKEAPVIPVTRSWSLVEVNTEASPDIAFDLKLVQLISDPKYKGDPRLKKLAERQFDLVTKTLEMQSAAKTALLAPPSTSSMPMPPTAAASQATAVKPVDPRTRDPRLAASAADPRLRNAQPTMGAVPAITPQEPPIPVGPPSDEAAFRSMVEQQIQMANQMAQNVNNPMGGTFPPGGNNPYDPHGPPPVSIPPQMAAEPTFFPPPPAQRQYPSPSYDTFEPRGFDSRPPRFRGGPRGRGRGFFNGPRERGRPAHFNAPPHHEAEFANHSPSWDHEHPSDRFTERPPPPTAELNAEAFQSTLPNSGNNPVSLREKRKHNEYESPLARVTSRY
jgi:hypothetical protein